MEDELNCKFITSKLKELDILRKSFNSALTFQPQDIESLLILKREIETKIENLNNKINTASYMLLKELKKDENWEKLEEAFGKIGEDFFGETNYLEEYKVVEEIFTKNLEKNKILLTAEGYKFFVEKLVNGNLLDRANNISTRSATFFDSCWPHIMLNAAFLNAFLKNDTVLNIDFDLPEEIKNHFGFFLKRGTINVKYVGYQAGQYIQGGTLVVEKATHALGYNMQGGTIIVKEAAWGVGTTDQGVRTAGTILFEKCGDYVRKEDSGIRINGYEEDTKTYFRMPSSVQDVPRINVPLPNGAELSRMREYKSGVYVIENMYNFSSSVTNGWEDGILVLRDLPEKNIGKGMKGGVVIIESTLSSDEVRKRLSKEDRTGGVILMRVPDPKEDNPNNTKLIDLENDEAGKI